MTPEKTREPQYDRQVRLRDTEGVAQLGLTTNQAWYDDPRHLLFILARYKFVAKMLSGRQKVLEVGCGDAFATRIVLQEVGEIHAVDFDPVFVRDVQQRADEKWNFTCAAHDMLDGPVPGPFDAAYLVDVLEHIPRDREAQFLANVADSLVEHAVLIVGTPSIQSQAHASSFSRAGHVNCKDHKELKELLERFFRNVFIFSMNDEVVHTGFYPMAHYLFALCCSKKPAPGGRESKDG